MSKIFDENVIRKKSGRLIITSSNLLRCKTIWLFTNRDFTNIVLAPGGLHYAAHNNRRCDSVCERERETERKRERDRPE